MKFIKNKWNIIFLIFGIILFAVFIYKFGINALEIIKINISFKYLFLFITFALLSFVPHTLRFKAILDSYGINVNLFTLIKQNISAFAISYITPASRLGGEPVRIYMMKKECKVDYEVGTTVVILDKFVEILGSALYGIIGLLLLIVLVGVPVFFRALFGLVVIFALLMLLVFYLMTIKGKKTLSRIFMLLRLDRINKFKNGNKILESIEYKMKDFFINHKKSFVISFMFYIVSGIFFLIEFKFLLLSIGINASLTELILAINIWGLMNFVPTPSSLGFLEAGQSGLFYLISGEGSNGLAMTLILRVGYILIACLGFLFISEFSLKRLLKKSSKT